MHCIQKDHKVIDFLYFSVSLVTKLVNLFVEAPTQPNQSPPTLAETSWERCLLTRFSSLRADNDGRFIFRQCSHIRGFGSIDDFRETVLLSFSDVPIITCLGNSDPKMLIYAGARVLSVFTLQISPRLCGAQDKRLKAWSRFSLCNIRRLTVKK